jgi:hypothetical protein
VVDAFRDDFDLGSGGHGVRGAIEPVATFAAVPGHDVALPDAVSVSTTRRSSAGR